MLPLGQLECCMCETWVGGPKFWGSDHYCTSKCLEVLRHFTD